MGQKQPEMCEFALEDVKTYFNEYSSGVDLPKYTASWDFEGLIRNKSQKKQYLKAMIANLYNEEIVLVGGGYTGVGKNLDSNSAIPFKINVMVSRSDTAKWRYYEENSAFNPFYSGDIYPWFTTCK